MKAYPGQSGTGLVLYDAWAVPVVITDMCCLLKFTGHYPKPTDRTFSISTRNPVRGTNERVDFIPQREHGVAAGCSAAAS